MKLVTHTPLKPLDLTRGLHAGKSPTHVSRSDLGGVISHPKRQKSDGSSPRATDPATRHTQLVEQTKRWVAQTFFGTLMKQMHESPFKSKMFEGGRGGEAFGQMYDQRLVEHMSRGTGNKLANAIVRKIESRNAGAAAKAAYERQGAAGRVAPPTPAGANGGGAAFSKGGHSPGSPGFGQRRPPTAAPASPFKNVRVHVETGR